MKGFGKLAIGLAGGLALSASLRADIAALTGDPYATVVTRNIFGLNPPPPPGPPPDATPPPKITPNGIMSIFGQLQVLFKVPGTAKAGVPLIDQSYILSEGQRQDDIEVMKIDEKNSVVTFNNHGETQELPLVVTQPSSTAVATPTGSPNGSGGRFTPGLVNPGGADGRPRPAGYGGVGVSSNNSGSPGPGSSGNNSGLNLGNGSTHNNPFNASSQIPEGMTEEVQTIAIEANRAVGGEDAAILPITELTPQDNSGTPPP
jgi:hypothetical protein